MLKIKSKFCLKQNQVPVWNTYSNTSHQSGTLIAEPDTCLEHCLDSNNTYTNYSSGHPISTDPLPSPPLPPPHTQPFTSVRILTIFFLTLPPRHVLDVINVWSLNYVQPLLQKLRITLFCTLEQVMPLIIHQRKF